jgi:hypothetical protein
MEHCVCINSIQGGFNNVEFIRGNTYLYKITKHEETGIPLYIVGPDDTGDILPLLEERFHRHFDNRQQLRERKINQILNEGDKQHNTSNT